MPVSHDTLRILSTISWKSQNNFEMCINNNAYKILAVNSSLADDKVNRKQKFEIAQKEEC